MEEIHRLLYYSISAIVFAIALSLLLYSDRFMDQEYDAVLYRDYYKEIQYVK